MDFTSVKDALKCLLIGRASQNFLYTGNGFSTVQVANFFARASKDALPVYFLPYDNYALTAPFVRPLTMYFCMNMKISTTGMIAMIPNAIVAFHRV